MTTWKLIFLWVLPCYQAENEGTYECGAHGRFEYCIDDIPGCVVGCHCHPGYYFDTETKICEPNSKLTQNYRRNYMSVPTRIQSPGFVETVEAETLPSTTHNVIDEHVNDITKNADDLGDWLYNQFFKTIENQVINKTSKGNQLTRRSGRDSKSKVTKPKLRARKKSKSKHRRRKKNKRQKLLQIEEDDSLFQSASDSEEDNSYSESSESSTSGESNSDENHGHRKIIMINKKPKPPLPSFIFLPNMNTPFYPPIGLPPPPVMPMYPMIPVPPVLPGPPMLPSPGFPPECVDNTTSSTTTTTTTTTTTIPIRAKQTTKEKTTVDDKTKSTGSSESTAASVTNGPGRSGRGRYKARKKKKNKSIEIPPDYEDNESFYQPPNFKPSRGEQQKLQLRQRINNSNIKKNKKNYMSQLIPPNTANFNNDLDEESYKNEIPLLDNFDEVPVQENVDFKYLSQLIHRVNETQLSNAPSDNYNPNRLPKRINTREWAKNKYTDFIVPINSGRRTNQREIQKDTQSDDSYYSNLGRQIASLIRTIDADNNRQFNIEIEKVPQKADGQLFFNENAPRTFWERSVRSPLKFIYPFNNRFRQQKNSNEVLFNIESKVENIVSTPPTLSLQEIENMINLMETAQTQFQRQTKIKNVKPSSKTLNINLWPKEIKQSKNSIKSSARSADRPNINKRRFINYSNNTIPETSNITPKKNVMLNLHSYANHLITHDLKEPRRGLQAPVIKSTSTKLYILKNTTVTTFPQTILKPNRVSQQDSENQPFNSFPSAIGYRNIKKYFFDDSNRYSFQNDNIPAQYSVRNIINHHPIKSLIPSPYFHHEINHVDYIA